MDDDWRRYISRIAASYHDRPMWMTLGGAVIDGALGGIWLSIAAGALGYLLSNPIETPKVSPLPVPACCLTKFIARREGRFFLPSLQGRMDDCLKRDYLKRDYIKNIIRP